MKMSESGPEPMEQDAVGSVPSLGLPDRVSEGFPLMEGDTEDIPRSEATHPPAALEEPEDKLEKLLGSFEDKKRGTESPAPEGKNGRQTLKKEILEHLQGNGFGKNSPVSTSALEEEENQRKSPVKKPAAVKTVRISLPLPSPKKYPSILSKLSPSQPKKPALQAIINDLRKEIEKENDDTSKIDLPVSGLAKPSGFPAVKRKYPSENMQEKAMSVSSSSHQPAGKRPRGYGDKPPLPASKLGQKPALLQMKQHRQVLSEVMKEMSSSGMHTDTTMIAGGQKVSVHRLVLAAASPFLKSVLADQPGDATIIIPETPYEDLAMLIDYVYCGESVVPEDRLSVILHLMSVLGFNPPIYSIRKGKPLAKATARPTPRPVGVSPEIQPTPKGYAGSVPAPKPVSGPRPVPRKIGGPAEEDTLAAAVRQIDDSFNYAPDRKVGACWIRQISKAEALAPRKKAIGRKIEVRPDKPSKTVIKLKEPFDRHKPRKVVIQRLDAEGEKTDDVNAALALTSLGGQPQQPDSQVMGEDLDAYQEANYQEGTYPESMLNSLLNTDQGGAMSMPSLDPDPLPEGKGDELHQPEGAYMLEDGTIIQGGGIEGLPITTEGSDGTTYILVMDENQENLDLNQVIQGLSGGGEGNQAMLRIEEDGTVSYAPTEDQADGGIYAAGDDDNGLTYTGMPEGFDGQHFEGQEYSEGYELEVKPKI